MESTRAELVPRPETRPSATSSGEPQGADGLSLLLLEFESWRRERQAFEKQVERLAEAQRQLEARWRQVITQTLSVFEVLPSGAKWTRSRVGPEGLMPFELSRSLELYEKSLIEFALIRSDGCQRRAARLLGMLPTTLNAKLKRLDVKCARHHRPRKCTSGETESLSSGKTLAPSQDDA